MIWQLMMRRAGDFRNVSMNLNTPIVRESNTPMKMLCSRMPTPSEDSLSPCVFTTGRSHVTDVIHIGSEEILGKARTKSIRSAFEYAQVLRYLNIAHHYEMTATLYNNGYLLDSCSDAKR
jgi:hypothetical protein